MTAFLWGVVAGCVVGVLLVGQLRRRYLAEKKRQEEEAIERMLQRMREQGRHRWE